MNPRYQGVASRAGHRCEYCHAPEAVFNFPFEVEHIIPVARGGDDATDNWALSCRSCNVRKWAHVDHVDATTGAVVKLFHPRRDLWQEHFSVDDETGSINGRTPTGRATIARLGMNGSAQRVARQLWIRLGLFP